MLWLYMHCIKVMKANPWQYQQKSVFMQKSDCLSSNDCQQRSETYLKWKFFSTMLNEIAKNLANFSPKYWHKLSYLEVFTDKTTHF